MVSCPICHKVVELSRINSHLDVCTSQGEQAGGKRRLGAAQDEDCVVIESRAPSPKRARPPRKSQPLSETLRPASLDEYIGQQDLVGPRGILRGLIETDRVPSMILWGPPGVGKTTLARIISKTTRQKFIELNATNSGIAELKKIADSVSKEYFLTKRRTILFCDEIHRYNKLQQDFFLPFIEKGDIVLIGATTENPSFQLNGALLSRCKVFKLKKLSVDEVSRILTHGFAEVNKYRAPGDRLCLSPETLAYLGRISQGDSRVALNLVELVDSYFRAGAPTSQAGAPPSQAEAPTTQAEAPTAQADAPASASPGIAPSPDQIKSILSKSHFQYDRAGDSHYDTISAFHKSIRGSNEQATMWYLCKMICSGEDPLYIARRMIRIASEDVGEMDETCLPFAVATYQSVTMIGLPEAELALVQCAVKLANAKKSVRLYRGWKHVKEVFKQHSELEIPLHLRNAPTRLMKELNYGAEYKYNPDYPGGIVDQEYLPEELKGAKFLGDAHLGLE